MTVERCKRCGGTMSPQHEREWVELKCHACGHRVEVPDEAASRLRPKGVTKPGRSSVESRRENQCECGKFIDLRSTSCKACTIRNRARKQPTRRCVNPDCQYTWRCRSMPLRTRIRCPQCRWDGAVEIDATTRGALSLTLNSGLDTIGNGEHR